MRHAPRFAFLLPAALLASVLAAAAEPGMDPETAGKLRTLDRAVDELRREGPDAGPEERASRGERLNRAFVLLTGEAVNPLFGVTALGMYNYFRADEARRGALPVYDRPEVWGPLLLVILLMLFNSTVCEALPFLKVPLNAIGDIVNKAGAAAVLPLAVKMFADGVAEAAGPELAGAAAFLFPPALAAEGASAGGWSVLGWAAGAAAGTLVYAAVWLTFNVVDVLILICPFPGLDAALKSFRLSIIGILAGVGHLSPALAAALAAAVVFVSFLVAGWSFRLSAFGWICSTDIVFFRRRDVSPDGAAAFAASGLKARDGVPMRTLGRVERDADGRLVFSYRPWLVLGRRRLPIGGADELDCGRGLVTPFLISGTGAGPLLRFPPRYRGREQSLVRALGLRGVVEHGATGTLRAWLSAQFGGTA